MSAANAIVVRGLTKQYRIGENRHRTTTLAERVAHAIRHPLRRENWRSFTALSDIEFEVKQGEAVGVIGRNGAGKSTLLKILSRITPPTKGTVELYGNLGSLLEVGTGFHPELTGRENIYLNGTILGMGKKAIRDRFDSIVEFSEVAEFLDTPVKRYSSGMYVRLAFAVAAHLEPEILIVDEVLAVGDAQFQQKCLGKIGEVTSHDGRTVLFVSHNMNAIQSICSRAIFLERGRIDYDGPSDEAIERYLQRASLGHEIDIGVYDLAGAVTLHKQRRGRDPQLRQLKVTDLNGRPVRSIGAGEGLRLELDIDKFVPTQQTIDVRIRADNDVLVTGFHSQLRRVTPINEADLVDKVIIEFPSLAIQAGQYFVEVSLADSGFKWIESEIVERAAPIDIVGTDYYSSGWTTQRSRRYGMLIADPDWTYLDADRVVARTIRD